MLDIVEHHINIRLVKLKSQKTVTIFDTDKNEITEIPVAFERDLRVLEGTYLELLEIAENDDRKDDYMKIIVKDRYPTAI